MGYLNALGKLLPPGIALDPQADEPAELLQKTARELEAVDDLDTTLWQEIDPRLATLLLVEYEHSLNLPDRCTVGIQSVAERRQAVYNKLVDTGGARRTRYLAILERLGQSEAQIERFTLHTCESDCEFAVFDHTDWLFTWSVSLKADKQYIEATCQSHCEEPLATWGNTHIECVLNREKQAHTQLIFKYIG